MLVEVRVEDHFRPRGLDFPLQPRDHPRGRPTGGEGLQQTVGKDPGAARRHPSKVYGRGDPEQF